MKACTFANFQQAKDQTSNISLSEIVAQHFVYVTPVMVREKLRDVVKPSRTNRTPMKC